MNTYRGSCHCGAIRFTFKGPDKIESGLRCNCSICRRRGHLWDTDRPAGPIHKRDICWRCNAVREENR